MKKCVGLTIGVLAVLAMGLFLFHCSSGNGDECKSGADCPSGYFCNMTTHECECATQCAGKECGPDGCGDVCGTCEDDETCDDDGQCIGECTPDCGDRECGMDPVCGTLSCGTCSAPTPSCNAQGMCVVDCTPNCTERECGPDPECQTSCGTCSEPTPDCNALGVCVGECIPDCGNHVCGMDPECGTLSCGTCPAGETCTGAGQCQAGPVTDECPADQDCTDITDGAGFFGCTEGGQLPDDSQTGCGEASPCQSNHSCLCADAECADTICTHNCGTCPTAQTCDDLSGTGDLGCLDDGSIPDGNMVDCDQDTPCQGNYSCWNLEAGGTICIENCSMDGPCQNGAVGCDGDWTQTCVNGVWQNGTDCSIGGETCFEGACASTDLCPTGQDCQDVIPGVLGCLLTDGNIPPGNPLQCHETGGCDGNFGCWYTNEERTESVCIENCGVCEADTVCQEVVPDSGSYGCLLADGNIPPGNQTQCHQTGGCNGNFSCWYTNEEMTESVCIGNCSVPH